MRTSGYNAMPKTSVVFFKEDDGSVPLIEWLDQIPALARLKCVERLRRLEELGHDLRRPEADLLRDGIHELRIDRQGIHYRILYFFHGRAAVVASHGTTKERRVANRDISLARDRKRRYEDSPDQHSSKGWEK
jgi:phage-related protein